MTTHQGTVVAVSRNHSHSFSKYNVETIQLLEGLGVEGDAHCGKTVKHRSRLAQDPRRPNLRQVHLLQEDLFAELAHLGFKVAPGELGENITTRDIPLLRLPTGTQLMFQDSAVVEITGLRNPCAQIDTFLPGLLSAVSLKDPEGRRIRKCGVMAVVIKGGVIRKDDPISIRLPPEPHLPLVRV